MVIFISSDLAPNGNLFPVPNLYTVKKGIAIFPSPAGISLTKLSLSGNNFPENR
jgi:hypothetical protein